MAIANALQLEAARCRAVPIRFNSSPKYWARSVNPRLSYWWLTTDFSSDFRGCSNLSIGDLKRSAQNLVGTLSDHMHTSSLKMVKISCSVSKPQRLKVERCWAIRPNIALFDPPPVKIRGGVEEIYGSLVVAAPIAEPLVYICWPASPRLLSAVFQ